MTNRFFAATAAFVATMMTASVAQATIFQTDYHAAGVWQNYDDTNEAFTFKYTDDGSNDGFWLVISDGENPKYNENEYAILYGDRVANRITAYTYDGTNSANSFRTSEFLGTFENAFSDAGERDGLPLTMFSIDVAEINAAFDTPEWDGVQTGAEGGIWFHKSEGSNFSYGADGSILDYSFADQMWLDAANTPAGNISPNSPDCTTSTNFRCSTTEFAAASGTSGGATSGGAGGAGAGGGGGGGSVPAPGGLALILMGLAGMGLRRKA